MPIITSIAEIIIVIMIIVMPSLVFLPTTPDSVYLRVGRCMQIDIVYFIVSYEIE